jgi:hypothetical protein
MPFEEDLSTALRGTADTFEPDLTSLVNSGVREGRRRRTRRTLGIVGSVTALALVGVGGTVATGALSGVRHPLAANAANSGGSASHGSPKAGSPSGPPVSAAQMIAKLEALLPGGTFTGASGTGTIEGGGKHGGGASARLVYNDGQGAAQVSVTVSHPYADIADAKASGQLVCPSRIASPYEICTLTDRPDGSVLAVHQSHEYTDNAASTKEWFATLTFKDGTEVSFDQYNSGQEKQAPATRTDPPLTPARMAALVADGSWAPVRAAIPAPSSSTTGPQGPGVSGAEVLANVRALLPAGVSVSGTSTQDGYAEMVLTDSHGSGFLTASVVERATAQVTPVKPGDKTGGRTLAEQFAHATVLADGSKLLITQRPSEKGPAGVLEWTATLLTSKGDEVFLNEYNDKAYQTPVSRATPVLTIAQLKQVITSPVWNT